MGGEVLDDSSAWAGSLGVLETDASEPDEIKVFMNGYLKDAAGEMGRSADLFLATFRRMSMANAEG